MEEKALTLEQLVKYTEEVLLPANYNQMVKYNEEILIPQLKDIFVSKKEFNEFKNESLTNQDKMLKKLDNLIQENEVRNHQEKKQKEFFAIMIKAMKNHNILSPEDLQKISQLNIF